jgi:4-methylaminobutanoate oxidase (formaldehyde-forming)
VGYLQVGAYGHTLGGAVGIGFAEAAVPLTQAVVEAATWEIEVAGTRYPCRAGLRPLFDPDMARVRA